MGVMHPLAPVDPTPVVLTPHPVTLDGQQFIPAELQDGETLGQFLDRSIDLGADAWEVKIGGVVVPVEHWDRVKPKHGHLIEVRGAVNRQALYLVAMVALTYFTMGAGTTAGAAMFGAGTTAAAVANVAIYVAGSILINKVLGPKPPKSDSQDRESVYNIAGARNSLRPHEPLGLLFGSTRIAPDIMSMPYTWYEGDDHYLGMVLTPGINVDRYELLHIGDTPITDYEGVTVWQSGFPGMPDQTIPLYSNVDTIQGAELSKDWTERTSSQDTVRLMVNVERLLGGIDNKGRKYNVTEQVIIQYAPVGSGAWQTVTRSYTSKVLEERRDTIGFDVPRGQYDVRVRIAGIGDYTGTRNTHHNDFTWSTLSSVQADDADYRGIPRIGIKMKATGQLNGTPDQIRTIVHGAEMPVWDGSSWQTATDGLSGLSNPGALLLAYARGFTDENGDLIAGMGLPDSMIDVESFKGFMLHCAANGYTYDHWLQSVRSHVEVRDAIALTGLGQTTWAGGKLGVVWAAAEQPLSAVANMATMKRGTFEVDYTLANAADGIEYSYYDSSTWQTATLRVPAPGVVTMLNPARLTGEGVTTEAHAAEMARYHLAQHLYQYKGIGFSTDLEHLTYKRLSLLALQHDMTKWGRGGRLVAAENPGGVVTLKLDAPVVAPTSGNAYIGLRVPGERVCRVFQVAPFAGETDTVTLVESWPNDAPFPGSANNPAHNTIWMFDFQATPGYRVRVVSIEPESGLKGARIGVVPESPEYWTYIKTGHYEPPPLNPMLPQRPIASRLAISETQVTQGDTVFTELSATFDVTGAMDYATAHWQQQVDGEWQPEAFGGETRGRTIRFRIPEAGVYRVIVRPFDRDGNVGGVANIVYTTTGADTTPPPFDSFDVVDQSSGMRRYTWEYDEDTTRGVDFAGAEIRYVAGDVASPDWDAMAPVGNDGFHTAAFDSVEPAAGTWTFTIRARNTAGELSVPLKITRTLGANIDEVIATIDPDALLEQLIEMQQAIDAEALARFNADAAVAQQAASDLLAQALAQDAAITAERLERQAEVSAAQKRIGDILSDEILSPDEKPQLILDYQVLLNELPGILAEAALSEVDAEPYEDALDALANYLATLTVPVPWNDTSDITYLT